MSAGNELAAATLETLPFSVAVIDSDGKIVLTNRAWREFGSDDSTDYVGVNYVATAAMSEDNDSHASRAVTGLEAVLEGDRDQFAMEYPCHSPDEKRWFTMRAIRFTVDGAVRVAVAHLDITDRRLAEIAAEDSAKRARAERQALEHVLERLNGLVQDVTDTAVSATSREAIERRVCDQFVETDPYVGAWVGRLDVTSQRLTPQAWAGATEFEGADGSTIDDEITLPTVNHDGDATHPAVRAIETGKSQRFEDETAGEDVDWWPAGTDPPVRSVVAVPISYGDVSYGVVVLYVADTGAITERELAVLDALGGTISTAINAIETQRMVTSDGVVNVELAIEDPDLFVTALADELGTSLEYRGLAYDEGTPLAFVHVDRADFAEHEGDVTEAATAVDAIVDAAVVAAYEDSLLLEVALRSGLVTTLGEHGVVIRQLTVSDGIADLALEAGNGQAARSIYDVLEERYDRVELLSYHETEQPSRTPWDLAATVESELTDRQQLALRKAYAADYFAWPRAVSGEELAASMDISRSTFHQHLRSAQRKLVEALFDGGIDYSLE
ncbi:histidine kinase [Salinadaptatus halalkaliphilus]|uniref:Histidine kinase n=1 Tax=Salinadaptatus halalkaliphilus TaxID=2419781 RepID=A0A4S3TH02_9EURY|nr:bacterio-opsin activator domain-containing protein [Salinadaptatus halalkaliphilus]THE63264.1 histidine kinase [Salinadaptatus halalkaliphilus]